MPAERVERSLTTILVTEMVGYSRPKEADESGTIAPREICLPEQIDPPD